MLCKANTIPPWVGTAGVSACGHVTHRSSGCWNPHLSPRVHQPQSVGGTEMTQPPGSLMEGGGLEIDGDQLKNFREKFILITLKKEKQAIGKKKKD